MSVSQKLENFYRKKYTLRERIKKRDEKRQQDDEKARKKENESKTKERRRGKGNVNIFGVDCFFFYYSFFTQV